MADLFSTYEEEWKTITDALYASIAKIPSVHAQERERIVGTVKERLQDAEDAVDGMSIACRGLEDAGGGMVTRLKAYRAELDDLKKQFQRSLHAVSPEALKQLISSSSSSSSSYSSSGTIEDFDLPSSSQSQSQSHDDHIFLRMQSADDALRDATRDTLEIERVAQSVMLDLHAQRTTMQSFRARLDDINAGLDRAGRVMHEMMRRVCGNRAIMVIVILLLVAGIVAIVWLRFFPPWSTGTTTTPVSTLPPGGTNATTTTTRIPK